MSFYSNYIAPNEDHEREVDDMFLLEEMREFDVREIVEEDQEEESDCMELPF